jgi:hypothetical protein
MLLPRDNPLEFNVQRSLLDLKHPRHCEYHIINIKAAIVLYENGTINGEKIFLQNGKMITTAEAHCSTLPLWIEACSIILLLMFFGLIF